MDDAVVRQLNDTLEVLRRASEVSELLPAFARRALSRAGKARVLADIAAIREAILALDGRCEECGKNPGEECEVGRYVERLCGDCIIDREADAADAAYDAWRDGER